MKRKAIKRVLTVVLVGITALAINSCNRDIEEFRFKGVVLEGLICGGLETGYVIAIETPDSIGDTVRIRGELYENAVMAYRSNRNLKVNETIYGVGYVTKDYAALHCSLGIFYKELPEVYLLSVDEKAFD